jgi:hypothetical protein
MDNDTTTTGPVDRTGASPAARPTEWIAAVAGLVTAVVAYLNDRDVAALVAVATGSLPTIVTAVTAWYDRRHGGAVTATPAGEDSLG